MGVSALRSPHNLRIYDAGNLGTAMCFIAAERLEGSNLRNSIRTQERFDSVQQLELALHESRGSTCRHCRSRNCTLPTGWLSGAQPTAKAAIVGCGLFAQHWRGISARSEAKCHSDPARGPGAAHR